LYSAYLVLDFEFFRDFLLLVLLSDVAIFFVLSGK
jgi:hypothetical protein